MARKKKRVGYRDSLTGAFVSKATWKRSKAHGGLRYKRILFSVRRPKKVKVAVTPAVLPAAFGIKTWFVTLKYTNTRGTRTFDFFVRARNRSNVEKYIARFAANEAKLAFNEADPRSRSVIEYLASFGWTEKRIAEIPKG